MVSPELLRRYAFFRHLQEGHLKALAQLSEELEIEKGEVVFECDEHASAIYLLIDGRVDLVYVVFDPGDLSNKRSFDVGDVNPGEVFGISALIEPYTYTTAAITGEASRTIRIDADALRRYCADYPDVGLLLTQHIAQTAMSRLHSMRVQLAAAQI
ncbi:MAG: Crp/Fnr family transcriptional regulator [Anaerolineae bacterium]|nr:Crp/Fnr family transcriptional regulator [Anaerolineae bacterium]